MHGNNFPSDNEALPSDTQSFQGLERLTSYHLHPPPASYQQFEVGQPVSIQQAAPTQSESTPQPSDLGRAQHGSMQMLLEASKDEEEDDENVEEEEEPDKIKEARAALRAKYEALSANEIRKECTNRELRLKSGMKKGERVDILVRIDLAANFFGNVVLGDVNGSSKKKKVGARTKHCMYRLLNILFSDEFAVRFSQSGNKAPRADLDTRAINDRSDF
ncbi:hypothetical protein PInf_012759 [Phytophthora infestans]|nr:hypothetical protein PInf_012759 [Phytophthora infestans]